MFKRPPFHQTNQWRALARKHKSMERRRGTWGCVDCGSVIGLESDHRLPVSEYPDLKLEADNLALRCAKCNQAKSNKVRWFEVVRYSVKQSFRDTIIATIIIGAIYAAIRFYYQ